MKKMKINKKLINNGQAYGLYVLPNTTVRAEYNAKPKQADAKPFRNTLALESDGYKNEKNLKKRYIK